MGAAIDLDGVGAVNGVDVDVVGVAWVAALHAPDVAEEGEGPAERRHGGGSKCWGGEPDRVVVLVFGLAAVIRSLSRKPWVASLFWLWVTDGVDADNKVRARATPMDSKMEPLDSPISRLSLTMLSCSL